QWEKLRARVPVPSPQPTTAPESASARCARSATVRNGGKASACYGEYQITRWPSSVLLALVGHGTDVSNIGQTESCNVAETSRHTDLVTWILRGDKARVRLGVILPHGLRPYVPSPNQVFGFTSAESLLNATRRAGGSATF